MITNKRTELEKSIEDILKREDEISTAIAAGSGSSLFSDHEIDVTNRLCLAFMTAVAHASVEDLRAAHTAIKALREKTLATDDIISAHVHANPLAIATIKMGQQSIFGMLTSSPRQALFYARIGLSNADHVTSMLRNHFTDLRHQLEEDEGKAPRYAAGLGETIGKKISKTLMKAYQQTADSVVTISGPRSAAKCEQIRDVAVYLAQAPRVTSIHAACVRVFRPLKDGYRSAEDVYCWCHRNEAKLMNYVNELRLATT